MDQGTAEVGVRELLGDQDERSEVEVQERQKSRLHLLARGGNEQRGVEAEVEGRG